MANKSLDTTLLDRAIVFAVRAHAGTERRGKGFPYIVHPMEAVEIVATMTRDQELLAAAALHDTVEDTDTTVEQIREEFGDRIASLVASESDTMQEGVSEEDSWHARKQAAIDRLAAASHDASVIKSRTCGPSPATMPCRVMPSGPSSMPRIPRTTSGTTAVWPHHSANSVTPLPTRSSNNSSIRCLRAEILKS